MKKIITFALCIMLLFSNNIYVKASSTGNEFYLTEVNSVLGYTSSDSNLPSSGNFYFGLTSDGFVYYVPMNKVIPIILTKGIGVVLKPEVLVDFIADYLEFGLINSAYKPVYSGTTKIGYAFDSLEGKTLLGSNNTTDYEITVPNNETNNVYEYYNDWKSENGYDLPDYINLETRNSAFYQNKFNILATNVQAQKNFLNSNEYSICCMSYDPSNLTYIISSDNSNIEGSVTEQVYVAGYNTYNAYIQTLGITANESNVPFTSQMLNNSVSLSITTYNYSDMSQPKAYKLTYNSDGTYTKTVWGGQFYVGKSTRLICSDAEYITVYKDNTVLNQIINKTYAPVSFNTQQYYDYSTSGDNSVSTTSSEVDNSVTNNETIYNSSAESFEEYYEENNYHIDNSVTISNTTEIVNNYYGSGDDNGGDDNGGGGSGDNDDDNGILDKLLDALIDLFKMLGKVIAAILTGIVDLITEVLSALTSILNAINPFTELLSTLFGFLPELVVNTLSAGLSICIMIAVIKFLRG